MADKLNLLLTSTAVAYFLASASMIFAGEEFLGYFGAARVLWHLLRDSPQLKIYRQGVELSPAAGTRSC